MYISMLIRHQTKHKNLNCGESDVRKLKKFTLDNLLPTERTSTISYYCIKTNKS